MKNLYHFLKRRYEAAHNNRVVRQVLFIAVGITATLWFLIRVIPKPSRATYPCMQTIAPTMSAFVIYLLSASGGWVALTKAKHHLRSRRFGWAAVCTGVILVCTAVSLATNVDYSFAQIQKKETVAFVLGPNMPLGEGKGIYPGRVVWAHAPGTAVWDQKTGYWFEDRWNNQEACEWMIRETLTKLTGTETEKEAWQALFKSFNEQHSKGNSTYQKGEKITIKINQNNTYSHDESEELNASPQLTLALLRSLVNEAGIAQEDISLIEPSRFLTNFIYNKCATEFPRIHYIDNGGGNGRVKSEYIENAIPYSVDNGKLATGVAAALFEADYNINMALLKGHVGQGVTLCGKNWYGITSIHVNWRHNAHNNFNQNRDGSPRYLTFVDFMGHKDIGGKTLVYFIDGLYGSELVGGPPSGKWQMMPFNNDWPNSLFASQDPVAIDAVGVDFLCTEFPGMADTDYSDSYLVEAARANQPASGTFYDPERDGTGLSSLGTVEHWNNPKEKLYSRNMGKTEGIELIHIIR